MPAQDEVLIQINANVGQAVSALNQVAASIDKVTKAAAKASKTGNRGGGGGSKNISDQFNAQKVDQFTDALSRANRMVGNMSTSFRRASMSISTNSKFLDKFALKLDAASMMGWKFTMAMIPVRNLMFQMAGTTTALTLALSKFGKTAGELEDNQRIFERIFGTPQEASKQLAWLDSMAPKIRATIDQVRKAGSLLAREGYDMQKLLMPLADLNAAINQEGITLEDAVRAFTDAMVGDMRRLKNTFHITKQDIDKFAQGAMDSTGRVINKSKMQTGILEAIAKKYGGMNKAMMGGAAGMWIQIASEWRVFMQEAGKPVLEFFKAIQPHLIAFIKWLTALAKGDFGKFAIWAGMLTGVVAAIGAAVSGAALLTLQIMQIVAAFKVYKGASDESLDAMIAMRKLQSDLATEGEKNTAMLQKQTAALIQLHQAWMQMQNAAQIGDRAGIESSYARMRAIHEIYGDINAPETLVQVKDKIRANEAHIDTIHERIALNSAKGDYDPAEDEDRIGALYEEIEKLKELEEQLTVASARGHQITVKNLDDEITRREAVVVATENQIRAQRELNEAERMGVQQSPIPASQVFASTGPMPHRGPLSAIQREIAELDDNELVEAALESISTSQESQRIVSNIVSSSAISSIANSISELSGGGITGGIPNINSMASSPWSIEEWVRRQMASGNFSGENRETTAYRMAAAINQYGINHGEFDITRQLTPEAERILAMIGGDFEFPARHLRGGARRIARVTKLGRDVSGLQRAQGINRRRIVHDPTAFLARMHMAGTHEQIIGRFTGQGPATWDESVAELQKEIDQRINKRIRNRRRRDSSGRFMSRDSGWTLPVSMPEARTRQMQAAQMASERVRQETQAATEAIGMGQWRVIRQAVPPHLSPANLSRSYIQRTIERIVADRGLQDLASKISVEEVMRRQTIAHSPQGQGLPRTEKAIINAELDRLVGSELQQQRERALESIKRTEDTRRLSFRQTINNARRKIGGTEIVTPSTMSAGARDKILNALAAGTIYRVKRYSGKSDADATAEGLTRARMQFRRNPQKSIDAALREIWDRQMTEMGNRPAYRHRMSSADARSFVGPNLVAQQRLKLLTKSQKAYNYAIGNSIVAIKKGAVALNGFIANSWNRFVGTIKSFAISMKSMILGMGQFALIGAAMSGIMYGIQHLLSRDEDAYNRMAEAADTAREHFNALIEGLSRKPAEANTWERLSEEADKIIKVAGLGWWVRLTNAFSQEKLSNKLSRFDIPESQQLDYIAGGINTATDESIKVSGEVGTRVASRIARGFIESGAFSKAGFLSRDMITDLVQTLAPNTSETRQESIIDRIMQQDRFGYGNGRTQALGAVIAGASEQEIKNALLRFNILETTHSADILSGIAEGLKASSGAFFEKAGGVTIQGLTEASKIIAEKLNTMYSSLGISEEEIAELNKSLEIDIEPWRTISEFLKRHIDNLSDVLELNNEIIDSYKDRAQIAVGLGSMFDEMNNTAIDFRKKYNQFVSTLELYKGIVTDPEITEKYDEQRKQLQSIVELYEALAGYVKSVVSLERGRIFNKYMDALGMVPTALKQAEANSLLILAAQESAFAQAKLALNTGDQKEQLNLQKEAAQLQKQAVDHTIEAMKLQREIARELIHMYDDVWDSWQRANRGPWAQQQAAQRKAYQFMEEQRIAQAEADARRNAMANGANIGGEFFGGMFLQGQAPPPAAVSNGIAIGYGVPTRTENYPIAQYSLSAQGQQQINEFNQFIEENNREVERLGYEAQAAWIDSLLIYYNTWLDYNELVLENMQKQYKSYNEQVQQLERIRDLRYQIAEVEQDPVGKERANQEFLNKQLEALNQDYDIRIRSAEIAKELDQIQHGTIRANEKAFNEQIENLKQAQIIAQGIYAEPNAQLELNVEHVKRLRQELQNVADDAERGLGIVNQLFDMKMLTEDGNKLIVPWSMVEDYAKKAIEAIDNAMQGLDKNTPEYLDLYEKKLKILADIVKEQAEEVVNYTLKLIGAPQELLDEIISPALLRSKFGYLGKFFAGRVPISDLIDRGRKLSEENLGTIRLSEDDRNNNWAVKAIREMADSFIPNVEQVSDKLSIVPDSVKEGTDRIVSELQGLRFDLSRGNVGFDVDRQYYTGGNSSIGDEGMNMQDVWQNQWRYARANIYATFQLDGREVPIDEQVKNALTLVVGGVVNDMISEMK